MRITIDTGSRVYQIDPTEYHDISLSLKSGDQNPNAYHINHPRFSPFCAGSFIGSVEQGGACNCEDITFNAHGNGTHTECIGHITSERISIRDSIKDIWIPATLLSVEPSNGQIDAEVLNRIDLSDFKALIIRTKPNKESKKTRMWSGGNPPYFTIGFMEAIVAGGIDHLLTDLPSVDPEMDEGKLQAHKTFWNFPAEPRIHATITEMIYVDDSIADGEFLLNLQVAPFHSDASPSRPILFPII